MLGALFYVWLCGLVCGANSSIPPEHSQKHAESNDKGCPEPGSPLIFVDSKQHESTSSQGGQSLETPQAEGNGHPATNQSRRHHCPWQGFLERHEVWKTQSLHKVPPSGTALKALVMNKKEESVHRNERQGTPSASQGLAKSCTANVCERKSTAVAKQHHDTDIQYQYNAKIVSSLEDVKPLFFHFCPPCSVNLAFPIPPSVSAT